MEIPEEPFFAVNAVPHLVDQSIVVRVVNAVGDGLHATSLIGEGDKAVIAAGAARFRVTFGAALHFVVATSACSWFVFSTFNPEIAVIAFIAFVPAVCISEIFV